MKKALIASVLLCVAGTSAAQSSITLFGVLDASVSRYTVSRGIHLDTVGAGRSQTVLANGANAASRLGFRGTEDLGGGYAVSFWLESPLSNDDGGHVRALNFSRRSTVSLSGGFGELRLGRDAVPTDWNDLVFSALGVQGVGASLILQAAGRNLTGRALLPGDSNAIRASNSVSYFLPPRLGGFHGHLMYAFPENAKSDTMLADGRTVALGGNKGRYAGGRLGYASGPLDIAVAYGVSTLGDLAGTVAPPYGANQFLVAYDARVRTINLGASYDLGAVKLMGELSQVRTRFEQPGIHGMSTGLPVRTPFSDTSTNHGWTLGATAPLGAGEIKFAYSHLRIGRRSTNGIHTFEPTSAKYAVGYVHHLSKRTALYATVARVSNKNGASFTVGGLGNSVAPVAETPNTRATGYDLGIRHAF
ncbi:porin [Variovorax sp. UC122_21]|uniref:porin n=1 Tax=Variovorax sp. UC122_21 TaxID=3374554 RepID=UPI003757D340